MQNNDGNITIRPNIASINAIKCYCNVVIAKRTRTSDKMLRQDFDATYLHNVLLQLQHLGMYLLLFCSVKRSRVNETWKANGAYFIKV